jgi:uncharacterized protein YegP (UPF0339 family)
MTHGRQVRDHQGQSREVRFHLVAPNRDHRCQPGYESKASAEKGIEAIKTHAITAKVEDHSET